MTNPAITFQMVGRLYSRELLQTAKAAVTKHGHGGKGDEFGGKWIMACTADYVKTCAEHEVAAHPSNKLAVQLVASLTSALN